MCNRQVFAVHLKRQEIYLFPLLFNFHIDAMQRPGCLFWFMNKKAVGRNVFWYSMTAVIYIHIPPVCTLNQKLLIKPFFKEKKRKEIYIHFSPKPCYYVVASGYSTALLVVNSQQFQLSPKPHYYWYKAKTLQHMARVSGNLTDGGLITSQSTPVLSMGLKDPAD